MHFNVMAIFLISFLQLVSFTIKSDFHYDGGNLVMTPLRKHFSLNLLNWNEHMPRFSKTDCPFYT